MLACVCPGRKQRWLSWHNTLTSENDLIKPDPKITLLTLYCDLIGLALGYRDRFLAIIISAIATENNSSDFSTDLKIERVDTKPQENAVAHHTERFDQVEHGDLIVRRGQPFRIVITFSKPFSQTSHTLSFSFMIGLYIVFNVFHDHI